MARNTNNKIRTKHLILCEGRDAEEFLITYLNCKALSNIPMFSNDFQVMDFGGINDLTNFLSALQNMEGFNRVESLLIVRDAERDSTRAITDIQTTLKRCNFTVPEAPHCWLGCSPKIGYLLFPTCDISTRAGTLEDLCLSILSEENSTSILGDIQCFIDSLGDKHHRCFPHEFKTKLHTYFSITDAYVSLKIGEAAKAGAFDWNSDKLLPLKNFLLELI